MVTVYDVDMGKVVELVAEEMKKIDVIKPPEWAKFVKTGTHNQRIPDRDDLWYYRVASVLRRLYIHPVGVQRLRVAYGGRKRRGFKSECFKKGSGNILRKALQQLEKAGLAKTGKKGREITPKGKKLLDSIAVNISKMKSETAKKEITVVKETAKETLTKFHQNKVEQKKAKTVG